MSAAGPGDGAVERRPQSAPERRPHSDAAGPAEAIGREHGLRLLRRMSLVRAFEERCVQLYTEEQIRGFMHVYSGQEAVATGVMEALTDQDAIVANYREHGHAILRGVPARAVMAEMFARTQGVSRGRGGSMHLFDASRRFYGGTAIVGAGLPLAVGVALADRMAGREAITACFFGDGAVAEGAFHESMNLAALWRLPVLFCCENNLYAMGTALSRHQSQTDLALKASSYAMPAWAVDGMDVLAVQQAARRAAAEIRGGGGPVFLECRTYRFRTHSMYDAGRYRSKEEVESWKERDPIPALRAALIAQGLISDHQAAEIERSVAAEVQDAVEFAAAGDIEPVEDLERFVYCEGER